MSFMYTYLLTFIQQTNYHLISYRTIAQYTFFPHASNSNFLIVIIWGLLLVTSLSSRLLIRSLFKANFFFLLLRTSIPIPAKPQGWQPTLIIRINCSTLLISSLAREPSSKCRILLIFSREVAMTSLATRTERMTSWELENMPTKKYIISKEYSPWLGMRQVHWTSFPMLPGPLALPIWSQ